MIDSKIVADEPKSGDDLETGKHLIQIEGLWGVETATAAIASAPVQKARTIKKQTRLKVSLHNMKVNSAQQPTGSTDGRDGGSVAIKTRVPVLYSTQKTKQVKSWCDGWLVFHADRKQIQIYDESGKKLIESQRREYDVTETEFEMDSVVVQLAESNAVDTKAATYVAPPRKKLKPFKTPLMQSVPLAVCSSERQNYEDTPALDSRDASPLMKPAKSILNLLKRKLMMHTDQDEFNSSSTHFDNIEELENELPVDSVSPMLKPTSTAVSVQPKSVSTSCSRGQNTLDLKNCRLKEKSAHETLLKTTITSLYAPPYSKNCDNKSFPIYTHRKTFIPDKFESAKLYLITLLNAFKEGVQIQLNQVFKKLYQTNYGKALTSSNPHDVLQDICRRAGCSVFSECSVISYFFSQEDSKSRRFILKGTQKTSNTSGKDDIWLLSKSLLNKPFETILVRSLWHGETQDKSLEISPLNRSETSKLLAWTMEEDHELIAMKLLNAGCELAVTDRINGLIELSNNSDGIDNIFPLENFLANPLRNKPSSEEAPLLTDAQKRHITNQFEPFFEPFSLNTDQKALIKSFCTSLMENRPVTLCHGVFGSGKSYVLSLTVIFLHDVFHIDDNPNKVRILISSNTNVAVDRILINLKDMEFENFVRVGNVKRVSKSIMSHVAQVQASNDDIKELQQMLKNDELSDQETEEVEEAIKRMKSDANSVLFMESFVVGVTCISCATSLFPATSIDSDSIKFPLVILDECSQITEPLSMLPLGLFGCRKALLVGDPLQLPPTLPPSSNPKLHGMERTLFQRLEVANVEKVMLKTQYRCHPNIGLCSRLFYDRKLIHGVDDNARKSLLSELSACTLIDTTGSSEVRSNGGSWTNVEEMKSITGMLEMFKILGVPANQIGIISLCIFTRQHFCFTLKKFMLVLNNCLDKSQCEKIKHELNNNFAYGGQITVATVDAFQGGEKDIIILSTVRANGQIGFIHDSNRLNVALSRARHHLIIFGDTQTLKRSETWKKIIAHFQSMANYIYVIIHICR